jgi:hypothetical protein
MMQRSRYAQVWRQYTRMASPSVSASASANTSGGDSGGGGRGGGGGLRLTAMRVQYPFDGSRSAVASSDPLVGEIFRYCKHTIETLYMDTTTDSNERERMPYAGDGYFAHETRYAVGGDWAMARHSMEYMFDNPSWCAPWIYMQVWHGWQDYMQTGSLRMLRDHYETHYKNALGLNFFSKPRMTSLGLYARDGNPPGTWPPEQLGNPYLDNFAEDGYSPGSNIDLWSNAMPAKTMDIMALIAVAMGDTANATFFRSSASNLSASINAKMFDRAKGCYCDGLCGSKTNHTALHSTVFPLDFGITPPQHRATCVQSMLAKFNESGGFLPAGYGTWRSYIRGLYQSAAEVPSAPQRALELLTQRTGGVGAAGYGYWHQIHNLNATTTPEQWSPPDYHGTCTWSHLWGSVPGHVIPQSLFGVSATSPAHAIIQVQPLPGNLSWGEATIPTIRGGVVIGFNQSGGFDSPPRTSARSSDDDSSGGGGSEASHSPAEFRLRVVLPPNVRAAVLLPALDWERRTYHFISHNQARPASEEVEREVQPIGRAVRVGGRDGLVGSGEHEFVLRSRWRSVNLVTAPLKMDDLAAQHFKGHRAFFIVFSPMLDAPEWPRAYNRYRGGLVVMNPFNATNVTVEKVRRDLGVKVLMYFDTNDIQIKTTGACLSTSRICNDSSTGWTRCASGTMPCCYNFNCDAFKTSGCPADTFAHSLQEVFKAEWAVNQVHRGSDGTPLCLYGKGPLFCHSARSNAALVPFLAQWVRENGFDGLYLDEYRLRNIILS